MSQKYCRFLKSAYKNSYLTKVSSKQKLLWCLKQFHQGKQSQKWLAAYLGIKPRRFRQLYTTCKQTQQPPQIGANIGRPQKTIPEQHKQLVEQAYHKHHLNALILEKIIQHESKIRLPHNTIHKIMLQKGYAAEQPSKQKRRKPWIRYERTHSLLAVHLDWHVSRVVLGMPVCVVLDDASRKVLSGGEFSNATAEHSVLLLKMAHDQCRQSYNLGIRECIVIMGRSFMLIGVISWVLRIIHLRLICARRVLFRFFAV